LKLHPVPPSSCCLSARFSRTPGENSSRPA
jgi:hypothetical protein